MPSLGDRAGADLAALPHWWNEQTLALVTGGNKGIGFEIARSLAALGMSVIITSRKENKGAEAVEAIKSESPSAIVTKFPMDVTDDDSIGRLAGALAAKPARDAILKRHRVPSSRLGAPIFASRSSNGYFKYILPWISALPQTLCARHLVGSRYSSTTPDSPITGTRGGKKSPRGRST